MGILSSDRREREIDQSPPQSQPALQPKRLDYQESFETSLFVHSMLVTISFWSMQGDYPLTVEHHQPSSLAHYNDAATDKHHFAATNGCVRAAVFMLLEACKIIVMYSVWICPFLLRSTVESIISCQTVMSYWVLLSLLRLPGTAVSRPCIRSVHRFIPLSVFIPGCQGNSCSDEMSVDAP